MLDHLSAPSLLWYTREQRHRLPAPADCTQLGLLHAKFGQNGPERSDSVCAIEVGGEGDDAGVSVVDGGLHAGVESDADAHGNPRFHRQTDSVLPKGEGIGRGTTVPQLGDYATTVERVVDKTERAVTESVSGELRELRTVALAERAHLDFLHLLLLRGQFTEELKEFLLAGGVERAGGLAPEGGEQALFGELRIGLGEGDDGGAAGLALAVHPGADGSRGDANGVRDLGVVDLIFVLQGSEYLREVLDWGGVLGLHGPRVHRGFYFKQVKVEAWRKAMRRATSPSRAVAYALHYPP